MGEELAKVLGAEFIRDIKHPDWLANLVLVPKKDKSWRLCQFQRPQQGLPEGPLPLAAHQPDCGRHYRTRLLMFPGRLLGVSPNQNEGIRPVSYDIHYSLRAILL
jgi:hypothetical protein